MHLYIGKQRNNEDGFTLIELSFAIIIIGLLTTAFLQLYSIQQAKRLKELQDYKIFTISDGLARYISENQHLPCPARRNLSVNAPNFGDETSAVNGAGATVCDETVGPVVAPGTCANGYCVAANPLNGKRIRIGSIPYKAIGVGKEDVIDIYGNQFTYAVVEDQATKSKYTLYIDGDVSTDRRYINLNDYLETETSRDAVTGIATTGIDLPRPVEMVFYSHGKDGAGAYNASGNANAQACPATGIDSENCNNDATFASDLYSVKSAAAVGVADDKLTYDLLSWVYIWDTASLDQKSIYNRDSGNMMVGSGLQDGDQKLHVLGNLRVEAGAVDTGRAQARQLCDENDANCFEPQVLGGDGVDADGDGLDDDLTSKRLQCKKGFVLKGVQNGLSECISVIGTGTTGCSGLQYINSLSVDHATGLLTSTCANAF